MPINKVELGERQGRIWPSKPSVTASGVVSVFQNIVASNEVGSKDKAALPRRKLTNVCMNHRGDALATSDSRGMLTFFRLTKNRYVQLKNLGCPVTCMQFSPLRKSELAVATRDGTIYIFDTDAQRLLATLKNAHKHGVANISFHPRNAIMITSSVDGINIWDLKKWNKMLE